MTIQNKSDLKVEFKASYLSIELAPALLRRVLANEHRDSCWVMTSARGG